MLKKIFLLIVVSFFISAIEIYSINSSPLLGQADINDLKVREDKIKELKVDLEYYTSTSDIYEKLYEIRPHRTDVNKDAYKMISLGLGINDLMKHGVILYEMSIFSICGKEKEIGENESKFIQHLSQYGPRAVSSNFDPNVGTYLGGVIPTEKWKDEHGKKLTLVPLGWFIISEMMGRNSLLFFEEKCSEVNNISYEKFLEGYTELYRLFFARLSFVESVLDEKQPWQGIYYLAYYPKFKKMWIATKSIPETEI